MLYCTYDQYAAAGGTVPETAFGVLCSRASRMIDAATFGRAERCAGRCQRLQRRLQRHLRQQCQRDCRRPAGSGGDHPHRAGQ